MKATGIVRRIDDLGRVVIPKEIRRTLRIREGGPLPNISENLAFLLGFSIFLCNYKYFYDNSCVYKKRGFICSNRSPYFSLKKRILPKQLFFLQLENIQKLFNFQGTLLPNLFKTFSRVTFTSKNKTGKIFSYIMLSLTNFTQYDDVLIRLRSNSV